MNSVPTATPLESNTRATMAEAELRFDANPSQATTKSPFRPTPNAGRCALGVLTWTWNSPPAAAPVLLKRRPKIPRTPPGPSPSQAITRFPCASMPADGFC